MGVVMETAEQEVVYLRLFVHAARGGESIWHTVKTELTDVYVFLILFVKLQHDI